MTVWGRMFGPGFTVTLESIVAKRKQRATRGLRDKEDPPAGAPSLFQGLTFSVTLNLFQGLIIELES